MTKQALEFYPESFNQLRKKLCEEHEDLWAKVGWNMAYDQLQFIQDMNAELDCLCLPEQTINEVCETYLAALKGRKGAPASKSLALLAYEQQGRVGGSIFGTADDDAAREDFHQFQVKKGLK